MTQQRRRLGFFTRVLDEASPAERYRLATQQIMHAETLGYDTAWVAQHHFNAEEGGLPAPFVFLAQVAARTERIRLGTGVITLPLEDPLRVAEDAAVLDALSGGRLEIGLSGGGTPSTFPPFGVSFSDRAAVFARKYAALRAAWQETMPQATPALRAMDVQDGVRAGGHYGKAVTAQSAAVTGQSGGSDRLYPAAPHLVDHLWQGTFSPEGGARAGRAGDGLMLSRTQPRSPGAQGEPLAAIQDPIIDAYLAALPPGRVPRIMASRSVFVADDAAQARRFAEVGLGRLFQRLRAEGREVPTGSLDQVLQALDVHLGTPQQVIDSLGEDRTLDQVTDLVVQVHSVDPPHPFTLRSIELMATAVAPALGWVSQEVREAL